MFDTTQREIFATVKLFACHGNRNPCYGSLKLLHANDCQGALGISVQAQPHSEIRPTWQAKSGRKIWVCFNRGRFHLVLGPVKPVPNHKVTIPITSKSYEGPAGAALAGHGPNKFLAKLAPRTKLLTEAVARKESSLPTKTSVNVHVLSIYGGVVLTKVLNVNFGLIDLSRCVARPASPSQMEGPEFQSYTSCFTTPTIQNWDKCRLQH